MPEGYIKIRDRLIHQGRPVKEAQRKAAAIWNKYHPDNPVGRHEKKGPKHA